MWPGPYGQGGGSRKYVLASLDQSLSRMGLDYVDIFYSHRFDPETPIAETMMALDHAVRSGKALYAGISSYSAEEDRRGRVDRARARDAAADPPAVVLDAQPLDREGPARRARDPGHGLHRLHRAGPGAAHRPLPQRRAGGLARGPAAARWRRRTWRRTCCGTSASLNEIAQARGQKLAQMALAWALRDPRVTSAVIGASSVEQLDINLDAMNQLGLQRGRAGRDRQGRRGRGHQPVGRRTEDWRAGSAGQPEHRVVRVGRELGEVAVDLPAGLGPVGRDDRPTARRPEPPRRGTS